MLSRLSTPSPDPLWSLMSAYRADPRPGKMELVVGVYRDDAGRTPVLDCVRAAEAALAAEAPSKIYRPPSGNATFNAGMARLLLGTSSARLARQYTIQTVGGTGALRLLADLVAFATPRAMVWITTPGYINHRPLMGVAGLGVTTWRWRERDGRLDLDMALDDLAQARRGDVVLLHGGCHNPSGVDPTIEGWSAIADLCAAQGLIPLVDMAYQGFGEGLEADAAGLRLLVDRLDTVLVAASCSKTMGLYCERTGVAMVVGDTPAALGAVAGTLERIASQSCFMAPDHGAAVAARLLAAPGPWRAELEAMRRRIGRLRHDLADAFARAGAPEPLQAVRDHRGMFSLLPLSPEAMARLRTTHGVYGAPDGRINVAGLRECEVERLARAVAQVATERRPRRLASMADLDPD